MYLVRSATKYRIHSAINPTGCHLFSALSEYMWPQVPVHGYETTCGLNLGVNVVVTSVDILHKSLVYQRRQGASSGSLGEKVREVRLHPHRDDRHISLFIVHIGYCDPSRAKMGLRSKGSKRQACHFAPCPFFLPFLGFLSKGSKRQACHFAPCCQEFNAINSLLDANEVLEGPHLSIRTRTRGALLKGPGLLQLVLELLELSPQLRVF